MLPIILESLNYKLKNNDLINLKLDCLQKKRLISLKLGCLTELFIGGEKLCNVYQLCKMFNLNLRRHFLMILQWNQ